MATATAVQKTLSEVLIAMAELEKRLADLKILAARELGAGTAAAVAVEPSAAAAAPVPAKKAVKPANAWIQFTQRVHKLLETNACPFEMAKHEKQFCAVLKAEKGYADWKDEDILTVRNGWEPPVPLCTECSEELGEDAGAHRECLRAVGEKVAAEGKNVDEAIRHWQHHMNGGKFAADGSIVEKKKPGRPKMTEEQKRAAAVARGRKLKSGAVAAAAVPAVAWTEEKVTALSDELESVVSVE